jgi:hypothetical protein
VALYLHINICCGFVIKFSIKRIIMAAPFSNAMMVTSDAPDSIAGVVRYEYMDTVNPNIRCLTIYEGIAQ